MESDRKVISILKGKGVADLTLADIDISLRMPNKKGRNRDIIVKLVSRMKKEKIVHNRKHLKGTGEWRSYPQKRPCVHMCVKKKMPDEVDQVWTYNGTIKYRSKMNQVCTFRYTNLTLQSLSTPIWNNIPEHMKSATTVNTFKSMLKKHLFYTN